MIGIRPSQAAAFGAALFCLVLPTTASCQSQALKTPKDALQVSKDSQQVPKDSQQAPKEAAQLTSKGEPEKKTDDVQALPASLMPVPAGKVVLGTSPEVLVEQMDKLHRGDQQKMAKDLTRLMHELGGVEQDVDGFYLGEFPVTNGEYKRFVEATGHRFPYHWWRYGQEEDYVKRIPEIRKQYPDDGAAAAEKFWAANWRDLPYAIPEQSGARRGQKVKGDDFPVTYVSWNDSLSYARWAGMRLPTEAERVRANGGEDQRAFPWGDDVTGLGIKSRDVTTDRLWEVGHFGTSTKGPFGHGDMTLGVWEWVNNFGFKAFVDSKSFKKLKKELIRKFKPKDKRMFESLENYKLKFRGTRVVIKGGMYSSSGAELRVQTRSALEARQIVSAVGFRVAKSLIPARDLSEVSLKLDYEKGYFPQGVKPDLSQQTGIERYRFADAERKQIEGYDAVSFVPVNFATDKKEHNSLKKLLGSTVEEHRPVVLGTLIVTVPIEEPKLEPGTYTVMFRASGAPKALAKDVKAAAKALAKGEAPNEKATWPKTLATYGIRNEDVLAGKIDYVRFSNGDLRVPYDRSRFILRNASGKYVAHWAAGGLLTAEGAFEAGKTLMKVEPIREGGETITVDIHIARDSKQKKSYTHSFEVKLAKEHAAGDAWVVPAPATDK